jgi:hypothetical protein
VKNAPAQNRLRKSPMSASRSGTPHRSLVCGLIVAGLGLAYLLRRLHRKVPPPAFSSQ